MAVAEEFKQKAKEAAEGSSASKYLLGAEAAVASVFATLQITGDVFSRMLANHPFWVGAAMVFAGLAAAMAVVTWILGSWFRARILLVGVGCFVAGTTCAVVAAMLVSADRGKPILAITGLSGRELALSVKLSNLKTRETVRIRVEPLRAERVGRRDLRYEPVESIRAIYEAAFGPDAKGDVDQSISVTLPPENFTHIGVRAWVGRPDDCYSETSRSTSCITREVTRRPERPQLTATWADSAREPRLVLKVSAQDSPPKGYAYLRARAADGEEELATWTLAPPATGAFERTLELSVPTGVDAICVEASSSALPDGRCTTRDENTSWVKLRVPARATAGS